MAGAREPGARERLSRLRLPPPTIRLRLTALYGALFLLTGAVLLTIGYLLVRSNLDGHHYFRNRLRALGLHRLPAFAPGSADARLARAVQQQIVSDALSRLVVEYVAALMALTLVSVITGWLLAGRTLRPLRAITATARRVSGENLGERIDLRGPADELRELADTFDGMLGRLDEAFASQRSFAANASHELRTPLAIMHTEIDVALADPDASETDLRMMGEAVRETLDRCEALIEGLLMLARSQAGALQSAPVDLAALAGDCVTDLSARSHDARIEVRDDLRPAWTSGDPGLLERTVANLLDNAIRHNERGGWVQVRTATEGGEVTLRVVNGGPTLDPAVVAALGEPFRRINRSVSGFGLGLSIVRSVVRAHGGRCEVRARPQGGLSVEVSLRATGRHRAAASAASVAPAGRRA
ncbi:MAG TPA: HAMP domain-containing sensor histidine kinase [Solirubrobacteraceae bacterium]|nr:HAMP domain-containing sensor histidine kinase [Solirubrobacteraceae bacterium]